MDKSNDDGNKPEGTPTAASPSAATTVADKAGDAYIADSAEGLALHPEYCDHANADLQKVVKLVCINDEVTQKLSEAFERDLFPVRLYTMIDACSSDSNASDIIRWLPHGRAFVFFDRNRLANEVMPRFLNGLHKFASFQRQLNLYGFLKLIGKKHTDKGAYYHPLFLRGRHDLSKLILPIRQLRSAGASSATTVRRKFDPNSEPNFDRMTPMPLLSLPLVSSNAIVTTSVVAPVEAATATAPSQNPRHRGTTTGASALESNKQSVLPNRRTFAQSQQLYFSSLPVYHAPQLRSHSTPPISAASVMHQAVRSTSWSLSSPRSQSLPEMRACRHATSIMAPRSTFTAGNNGTADYLSDCNTVLPLVAPVAALSAQRPLFEMLPHVPSPSVATATTRRPVVALGPVDARHLLSANIASGNDDGQGFKLVISAPQQALPQQWHVQSERKAQVNESAAPNESNHDGPVVPREIVFVQQHRNLPPNIAAPPPFAAPHDTFAFAAHETLPPPPQLSQTPAAHDTTQAEGATHEYDSDHLADLIYDCDSLC